jgi:hypothetical protein
VNPSTVALARRIVRQFVRAVELGHHDLADRLSEALLQLNDPPDAEAARDRERNEEP